GRARSRLLREKEPVEVVLQVVVNQAAPDVVREFEVPGHRHQPVIEHPTEGLPPLNHLLHPARGTLAGLGAQARHLAHDCTPSHSGGGTSWVIRSFRWWLIWAMCGKVSAGMMARLFAGSTSTGTLRSSRLTSTRQSLTAVTQPRT